MVCFCLASAGTLVYIVFVRLCSVPLRVLNGLLEEVGELRSIFGKFECGFGSVIVGVARRMI